MKRLEMALSLAVVCLACHFSIQEASHMAAVDENKRLIVENEKLRSFNVRRERRLKWMMKPKNIDADSVSQASHILGPPPFDYCGPALLRERT